jgi:cytochrome c oxidase subunit II
LSAPLTYTAAHGPRAALLLELGSGLTLICFIGMVIALGLLLLSVLRHRHRPALREGELAPRSAAGVRWVAIGTAASTVVLFAMAGWTMVTMRDLARTPSAASLTLEVTGHQWWWEVRYLDDDPARIFTTAEEIHIPTDRLVRVRLIGNDVIHSFWVPQLAGKTDIIPGQRNEAWLQADTPGTYRGQCTEYCGRQHANMAFFVIAEDPAEFEGWRARQRQPAAAPADPALARGRDLFVARCGTCHTVRGSGAGGILGPDLSHLMSRRTLAAGTLPNQPGFLAGWIADPQHFKPDNRMPRPRLTGPELEAIRTWLQTLE